MVDYYKLKKGSVIEEYGYGYTIRSTIITDIERVSTKGGTVYEFEAITENNGLISYMVGGIYTPNLNVINY